MAWQLDLDVDDLAFCLKEGKKEKKSCISRGTSPYISKDKGGTLAQRAVSPLHHKAGTKGASGVLEDS
eukprot:247040-Pelagomonas_calceolata.AAC.1